MTTIKATATRARSTDELRHKRVNISLALNEKIARAQAIISLAAACRGGEPMTALSAADELINEVIASLVFLYSNPIEALTIAAAYAPLAKARSIISIAMLADPDDVIDGAHKLAADAAIHLLDEAMCRLEQGVEP